MKPREVKVGDSVFVTKPHRDITPNKVYQVSRIYKGNRASIIDDAGDSHDVGVNYQFTDTPILNHDIIRVMDLINNKKPFQVIGNIGSKHTARSFEVVTKHTIPMSARYSSLSTNKIRSLKDGELAIIVNSESGGNLPLDSIEEIPQSYDVKLNHEYTATITKDTIKVGCQTFPISILDKLQDARKKFQ